MVPLRGVKMQSVEMLWELMIRIGWDLPSNKSRLVTHVYLLKVRDGNVFGVK